MKKYFPTIFIGLGGSGSKTIQHLRKLCMANPEYRAMVDHQFIFSALDTDVDDLRSSGIPDENLIRTSENVNVARYIDDKHKQQDIDFFSWWPGNTGMLNTKPLDKGAGQIRITSRLGFHYQIENNNLKDRINKLLTRVQGITENVAPGDTMLKVYVIASLSGGTGSAIATMIGYLVHELLKGRKLDVRGVFMMPEIFCQQPQDPTLYGRLRANGYAVLKELESAISFADSDRAYIDYIPEFNFLALPDFHNNAPQYAERYLSERPFDWCVIFDKLRDTGVSFQSPGNGYINYYKQLAHCLYMQVFSPIANKAGSAEDNYINSLLKSVSKGEKSRRYSGFGFSALIFPQRDIANRLAHEYLVDMLGTSGYWIKADSEYRQRQGDFERKKAEGVTLAKPKRHDVFCEAMRGHLQKEYPDPFRGILKNIDGFSTPDDREKAPAQYNLYVQKILERFSTLYKQKIFELGKNGSMLADWAKDDFNQTAFDFRDNNISIEDSIMALDSNYRQFCNNELGMIVNDILLLDRSPGASDPTRLISELCTDGGAYKGIFEIRYFLSRLYQALDILHTAIEKYNENAPKYEDRKSQFLVETVRKARFIYRVPGFGKVARSRAAESVQEFVHKFYNVPKTAASYKLPDMDSFERDDATGAIKGDQLKNLFKWNSSARYLDALRQFLEALMQRLSPEDDAPRGLINHVHTLFDNMAELKRKFENDLQALKFTGKYEDYDYPDNAKVFVYSNEDAIAELKDEIKRMKSDEIVGEFYNDMSSSVIDNWSDINTTATEHTIRGIPADESREKLKADLRHLTDNIVQNVADAVIDKCFKSIYASPALNIPLGVALQKEAVLKGLYDPRDIKEYKKDKVKTAFSLSAPFVRLSKGDNRVNKLEAVTCSPKVFSELQEILEEYVKSYAPMDFEADEKDGIVENLDNRVLFYQTYLAFGLEQIDNLFFGDASLKQAYYQELQESAITPHIHKDWARELDDLDDYFNEETKAMFMAWVANGKLERSIPAQGSNTQASEPACRALENLDYKDKNAVAALVHTFKDPSETVFISKELKIHDKNLHDAFKYFRINYPAGNHAVSKKRLEDTLAEKDSSKKSDGSTSVAIDWPGKLKMLMRLFRTYLDDPATGKQRDNIFIEGLYNAVIRYALRMGEPGFAVKFKAVAREFEPFVWPKNDL
jgi:hypothetical protein